MFKLVISDDEGKTTVVPLVRDEISIGRQEGNTIRLTERNISRTHARLYRDGSDYVLEDQRSYNGVLVNGQRIAEATTLSPGDQIQVGDYQAEFRLDEIAQTLPDAAPPVLEEDEAPLDGPPGPPARLVMLSRPTPGAEFALSGDRIRVGRAEDLDIWINHRSISREHAEIQREPGGFRLIDLDSINGVRVNGRDVQNALLSRGDEVELGQVLLRFVAAGELFDFDIRETRELPAVRGPTPGISRTTVVFAVLVVLLSLLVGGLLALGLGQGGAAVVEDAPPTGDPFGEQLETCRRALQARQPGTARTAAENALLLRPEDPEAADCRQRAVVLRREMDAFAEARRWAAGEQANPVAALRALSGVRPESPLWNDFEPTLRGVAAGLEQVGDIDEAQHEQLRGLADRLRRVDGLDPDIPAQIEAFLETRGVPEETGADLPDPLATRPGPSREPAVPPRVAPRGRPRAPRTAAPEPSTPEPASPDRTAEAHACAMEGDNECIIRLLAGRTGRRDLEMLIDAYRHEGQERRALASMREYVRRYPGSPRTGQYQQILRLQGG
jgi:pSer/pThr/pTyr-binding forkhead associated (FHA) protein